MRTNKGFFSKALFIENIKRFWPMAFAGFIVYFLSGPMLVITEGPRTGIRAAMMYINPGYLLTALTISVAAAVCVFGYLQKVSSTSVMHSMPFSRRSLYVTSYASGLALAMLPAIATALLLIVFKKPVFIESIAAYSGLSPVAEPTAVNVYTMANIGRWFVNQFVLIWFSYTISVFGGIISGNGVIHMLTACGLNCIVPVLYVLYKIYKNVFLFGVTYDEFDPVTLMRMHPVFSLMRGSGYGMMDLGEYAWRIVPFYVAVPVIVLLLGYFLYRLRPLERATDSYVFRAAALIIGMLLVVVFGSIIGLLFKEVVGNFWGFIIGGLVSFVIAEMIVRKTMKIIDREGPIHLAVCSLAMLLIVGGFAMDFFGVENAVPKIASVDGVEVYSTYAFESLDLKDPANIERIQAVHENILSHKEELEAGLPIDSDSPYFDSEFQNFHIIYKLKNGRKLERLYSVPVAMICEGGHLQDVYDTGESLLDVGRLRAMDPAKVTMDLWYGYQDENGAYYDRSISDYELTSGQRSALISAVADEIEARRADILGWYEENGYRWRDKDITNGYLSLSSPVSVAEAGKLEKYSLFGGVYYAVEKELNDKGEVIRASERLEYDLSICGDELAAVVAEIGREIPGDDIPLPYKAPEPQGAEGAVEGPIDPVEDPKSI